MSANIREIQTCQTIFHSGVLLHVKILSLAACIMYWESNSNVGFFPALVRVLFWVPTRTGNLPRFTISKIRCAPLCQAWLASFSLQYMGPGSGCTQIFLPACAVAWSWENASSSCVVCLFTCFYFALMIGKIGRYCENQRPLCYSMLAQLCFSVDQYFGSCPHSQESTVKLRTLKTFHSTFPVSASWWGIRF